MTNEISRREPLFTLKYFIICFINFTIVISSFPLVTILPLHLQAKVTVNPTVIGLAIGIYPFAALVSRFIAGWLLDNYALKRLFRITLLIYALFFPFYALIVSPWFFVVFRMAHGFFFGVVMTIIAAAVIRVIPLNRRGEGVGYFSISLSLGMALGPFIALNIVNYFSFNVLFFFLAVLIFASLALVMGLTLPEVEHRVRKPFILSNLYLKKGTWLMFNVFLVNMVYAGLVAFVAMYAYGRDFSDGIVAAFFLIMAMVMLCSRLFAGRLFDANGPLAITCAGTVFLGLGSLLMALSLNVGVFLGGGACVGLGIGILLPVLQTMINNIVDAGQQGVANATYYVGLDLGWVGGTTFTGFIVGLTSISGAYLMNAGLCIVSLVLFLAVILKHYNRNIVFAAKK